MATRRAADTAPPGAGWGAGRLDGVVVAYLAVAVVVVVQLAVLGSPQRTLRHALPYAAAAACYLAVRGWRRRGGTEVRLLAALALAGAALAAWVTAAFLIALPSGVGDASGFYRVKVQVTSPVGDHNTAAGLLLVSVAAAAVLASRDRRWHPVWVLCGVGLVATLSRGAALVLVIVVLLAWRWIGDRSARWRLLAVGVASLAAVLALAGLLGAAPPGAGEPRAAPEPDGWFGASLVGRVDLVERGVELAAERPVAGVGLGRFVDHAADLPPPNDHAHNLLANAAAEGGLVLLVVAVALPVVGVVRLRRLGRGQVRDAVLVGGAALVLHAQHDILGGLVGYEVLLAVLLAAVAPPLRVGAHGFHDGK